MLAHVTVLHATSYLFRPTSTYRALELDVPALALGAVAATFAMVPLVLAIPTGALVDRFGEKRLMLLGSLTVLASCVFTALMGSTVLTLLIGNGFLGAGHLICVVAQQALIANNSGAAHMDAGFGYLSFAASLGQALGPLLITAAGGTSARPDTHLLFLLATALALALVVVSFCLPGKAAGKRSWTKTGDGTANSTVSLLKEPGVLRALAASAAVLAVVDLTVVYVPALGAERGLSAAMVGLMLAVRSVFAMMSRIGLGYMSRRLGRTRLMFWSLVLSMVSFSAMALPLPAWLLFVALAALGLGLGVGQPLTMSWLATRTPNGQRGRALALRLAGNSLGQVLLPTAVGTVAVGIGASGVLLASAGVLGVTLLLLRDVSLD